MPGIWEEVIESQATYKTIDTQMQILLHIFNEELTKIWS